MRKIMLSKLVSTNFLNLSTEAKLLYLYMSYFAEEDGNIVDLSGFCKLLKISEKTLEELKMQDFIEID